MFTTKKKKKSVLICIALLHGDNIFNIYLLTLNT